MIAGVCNERLTTPPRGLSTQPGPLCSAQVARTSQKMQAACQQLESEAAAAKAAHESDVAAWVQRTRLLATKMSAQQEAIATTLLVELEREEGARHEEVRPLPPPSPFAFTRTLTVAHHRHRPRQVRALQLQLDRIQLEHASAEGYARHELACPRPRPSPSRPRPYPHSSQVHERGGGAPLGKTDGDTRAGGRQVELRQLEALRARDRERYAPSAARTSRGGPVYGSYTPNKLRLDPPRSSQPLSPSPSPPLHSKRAPIRSQPLFIEIVSTPQSSVVRPKRRSRTRACP